MMRKIVTHAIFPPIPTTKYDWCAFGDHRPTVDWSREIDRILGTPVESSASTGPTATRDQPIRRTGIHPMHLGSNRD